MVVQDLFDPDLQIHETIVFGSAVNPNTVPQSQKWPAALKYPLAWKPTDLTDEDTFIYNLDQNEISEITTALKDFQGKSSLH